MAFALVQKDAGKNNTCELLISRLAFQRVSSFDAALLAYNILRCKLLKHFQIKMFPLKWEDQRSAVAFLTFEQHFLIR